LIPPSGADLVKSDMGRLKTPLILAAVGIGAFTIPYIITTLVMRHNNTTYGYPTHLTSKDYPAIALNY